MGMYTELFLSCSVVDDPVVVEAITALLKGELPLTAPDHEFFQAGRARYLFTSRSYYFQPRTVHLFDYDKIGDCWILLSRSDLKNYDKEIQKFIDWLRPYLDDPEGKMIGYTRYEEDHEPTILYAGKNEHETHS